MPSVAGAVVRGGEVVWADAVGLADAEQGEAATPDHQYRIGSITKTFTAVARHAAARRRASSSSKTGSTRTSTCRARGDLTLRRMLAHGSGLQREIPGDVWETLEFPKSTEELLATLEQAEAVLAPGERWHYSNLAFILLGEVVARLSGMPYEDYVEQRILQPLGLARTSFSPEPPTALAYSVEPYSDVVRREPMLVERTGGIAAAGQLWSTVGDLCRWASFLADPDPDVLAPESLELMTSVQTMADPYRWSLAWGVGLMLARKDDRIYCGHDGGMPGYLANVLVDRDERLGAAVLVNGDERRSRRSSSLALIDKTRERFPPEPQAWQPQRGAARRSLRARSDAGGRRARSSSSAGTTAGSRRAGPRRRRGSRGHDSSRLDGDRFRTAFGRERGELLRLVRDADGAVTRMYWATYPLSREPEVTGTAPVIRRRFGTRAVRVRR